MTNICPSRFTRGGLFPGLNVCELPKGHADLHSSNGQTFFWTDDDADPLVDGRQPFTMQELFGHGEPYCLECGCPVSNYAIHVTWHNKVADL